MAAFPAVAAAPLGRFVTQGALAVCDQGLFSGANFLTSICLARWLAPADYGAYSLAFAVFLLVAAVHSALLIEPMMIFGAGKYARHYSAYIGTLLRFHVAVLAPGAVVLAGVAVVLGRVYTSVVERGFLGLAAGSIFILAFWLVRRVPYVLLKPGWGVIASLVYGAVMAASVWALKFTGNLTVFTAFLAMSLASLAATLAALYGGAGPWPAAASQAARPQDFPQVVGQAAVAPAEGRAVSPANVPHSFREVAIDHWRYGRWAIASAAVSWFPAQVYYALLPAWIGLEGSAGLRALTNFVMPVLQAIAALNMLLLPTLVRDRRAGGPKKMNSTMLLFLTLFCGGCAVYLTALWVFHQQVFQLFYGGRYAQFSGWPLLLAGALPLGTCATAVLGNAIRALERPDRMFWAYIGSAASAAVLGIPLAARFGVSGALLGIHLSSFTLALFLWFFYRSLAAREVACKS